MLDLFVCVLYTFHILSVIVPKSRKSEKTSSKSTKTIKSKRAQQMENTEVIPSSTYKYSKTDKGTIDLAVRYGLSLVGIPYRWMIKGEPITGDDKFYARNEPPISADELRKQNKCIVCVGVINLMRRFIGLSIPGAAGGKRKESIKYAGTTYTWFRYLNKAGRLEEIDIHKSYPKGTLILHNYVNIMEQGHVAVVVTDRAGSLMEQDILHSFSDDAYNEKDAKCHKDVGAVTVTPFKVSHYYESPDGYFTHICLPHNWLLLD